MNEDALEKCCRDKFALIVEGNRKIGDPNAWRILWLGLDDISRQLIEYCKQEVAGQANNQN